MSATSADERAQVGVLDLAAYQRVVRRLLVQPLLTDSADVAAVRRFEPELRVDLETLTRYRLEVTPTCARLVKRPVDLDASRPLRRANADRSPFDRRRYAYLCLVLAALGRAGIQTTISSLAESLRRRAGEIELLGFDPDVTAHRRALVDVLTWLESRGAIALCDGSSEAWMLGTDDGDALYDVDRDVVHQLFQPSTAIQAVRGVGDLLTEHYAEAREAQRRRRRHRIVRRLLENPVLLHADLPHDEREYLRREGASIAADVERFTGCRVERRAEGMALIDVAGRCSDVRFPGTSTVAWASLLLLDKMLSARHRRPLHPAPTRGQAATALGDAIDAGLPPTDDPVAAAVSAVPHPAPVDADPLHATAEPGDQGPRVDRDDVDRGGSDAAHSDPGDAARDDVELPRYDHAWLRRTVGTIARAHAGPFRTDLVEDPDRLTRLAVEHLADLDLVRPVADGVVLVPIAARYRPSVTVDRTGSRRTGQPRDDQPSLLEP